MITIAPSLLSCDFLHLEDEIVSLEKAGADRLHLDVMDGRFVPNLTFGPPLIKAIKKVARIPLDVHLMIKNPDRSLDSYIDSGADIITVHVESCLHLERTIKAILEKKVKAAVALNPSTHESALEYVLNDLDGVLVMSVNPGFGGQRFLKSSLKKISSIKAMLKSSGNEKCFISVDGGIDDQTASEVIRAGANCLVSGSYIFSHDYKTAIDRLRCGL